MFSEGEPTIKTVGKYYDLFFENYAPLFWGKGKLVLQLGKVIELGLLVLLQATKQVLTFH